MHATRPYLPIGEGRCEEINLCGAGRGQKDGNNLAETKVKERESECFVLSLSLSFINPC